MAQAAASQKTLFIRLSSLGDVILTEATIRAYKDARPEAEVHFLTKEIYRDVVGLFSSVDRVISAGIPRFSVSGLPRGTARPRDNSYCTVVDLQRTARSMAIALSLRPAENVGYYKASLKRRLMPLGFCRELGVEHTVRRYLSSLTKLGMDIREVDPRPRIDPDAKAVMKGRNLLERHGWTLARPLVAVIPGARWPSKRWPARHFAGVIDSLRDSLGAWCVLLGSAFDGAAAQEVQSRLPATIADMTGKTDLIELAAILKHADLTITNDSGPMHLSTAVGTPVIAVFGPTTPSLGFAPLGKYDKIFQASLDCRPCSIHGSRSCRSKDLKCMTGVRPEEVAGEAVRILKESSV